jgi:hypothetical protein
VALAPVVVLVVVSPPQPATVNPPAVTSAAIVNLAASRPCILQP